MMKHYFLKHWWAFPFLLIVPFFMERLLSPIIVEVDWSMKVPLLIILTLVFLMTLIVLLASLIILLRNRLWWKALISFTASILLAIIEKGAGTSVSFF